MEGKMYLAVVGDPGDISTFGGTPYYFLKEGVRQGLIEKGLAFNVSSKYVKLARIGWSVKSFLSKREFGGYQFSNVFLEKMWQGNELANGDSVINMFQLYPATIVSNTDIHKWFYIDQTLNQSFSTYGVPGKLGVKTIEEILEREKRGYWRAKGIFVVSESAKQDLITTYKVDGKKIFVVPRGANIDIDLYKSWCDNKKPSDCLVRERPLHLVFVGKDAHRKGLDRLLGACALAEKKGYCFKLTVVGTEELKGQSEFDGVTWVGYLNKKNQLEDYLNLLVSADVGCLLSRAEAGGISLREFHAAGLPVLFPNVGGSKDFVLPDASFPVEANASTSEIADILIYLDKNREMLMEKKSISWGVRETLLWSHAVKMMKQKVCA